MAVLAAACVSDDGGSSVGGVTVVGELSLEEMVVGLDGPTQFVVLDDGRLLVAEIGGEENGEAGQVRLLPAAAADVAPLDAAEGRVLVDQLDKPTGLGIFDGRLWVMERNALSAGVWSAGDTAQEISLDLVVGDLPFNGRSEGTLTPTPDGDALLYNTSGRIRNGVVEDGSGQLRSVSAAGESSVVATGLKHGYAHVFDSSGQLWVTEVSDGDFDGEPASDELVQIAAGDDAGWPKCVGDNRPVAEFGADRDACTGVAASQTLFGPRATPTSVVVSPWDPDVLLVALWVTGEVVEVSRTTSGMSPTPILSGLSRPQHLVVDNDRVLLSEFETGRILELTR